MEYAFDEEAFMKKVDEAAAEEAKKRAKGENGNAEQDKAEKQVKQLVQIAKSAGLFHAPNGTAYADVIIGSHRETYPIRGKSFKSWLLREFYKRDGDVPNPTVIQGALGLAEAAAQFDGVERQVFVRVGTVDGKLYLDLADENWSAIEIDAKGWRPIAEPPVRFRRASGMLALPMPKHGGKIESLRKYLNVKDDNDFVLAVAWLLAALRDCGPYPVLALYGEHGTAKSTFTAMLRAMIDPNTAPLRALPRDDRDLFIAANNSHVLAFDNVSHMPNWLSDTLCRLATGGGFATRQLYTDEDEKLFDACRPILLNGIEDFVTRADLADRTVFIGLQPIADRSRKASQKLTADFESDRPAILGALLSAVSHGLHALPMVELARMPRMADFAKWAVACEPALWMPGTFTKAYDANRAEAINTVIEADPVATALVAFMEDRAHWSGTASQLLGTLGLTVPEGERRGREWPTAPNKLSNRLRRQATFLRAVGITIEQRRTDRKGTRTLYIEKIGNPSSEPSGPSDNGNPPSSVNDLAADDTFDGSPSASDGGSSAEGTVSSIVRLNQLKNKGSDGTDVTDDKIRTSSINCIYCGKGGGDIQRSRAGVPFHPECRRTPKST